MKHKHITNDMIELMEEEMLFMWQSGEAKHILKDDPGFIKVKTVLENDGAGVRRRIRVSGPPQRIKSLRVKKSDKMTEAIYVCK